MKSVNKIYILLIILFVINLLLFISYAIINPELSFSAQILNYLGSVQFQFITISIGLPILLLLFDNVFKVREKVLEEKKEKQLGCIKNTHNLWNDLANICVKFIYAERLSDSIVSDLKKDIEEFIIKTEEISNTWYFEFVNLNDIIGEQKLISNIFITPFDILECSITSIINRICLGQEYDKNQFCIMQEHVKIMYNGIKICFHQSTINILKNSMLLNDNSDEDIENEIKSDFNNLKKLNRILLKEIISFYKLNDVSNHLEALIEKYRLVEYEKAEFKQEFNELCNNLTDNEKMTLRDIHDFSDELIKKLAQILKMNDLIINFYHYNKLYIQSGA